MAFPERSYDAPVVAEALRYRAFRLLEGLIGAGVRLAAARDGFWLALLGGLYIAAALLIDPRGDFPLHDDWSFAGSVRILVNGHDWRPIGWAAMTQISHALLGAVACSMAACTHETLRFAVLLMGLLFLLVCFALFRRLGAGCPAAALGAGAVTFNPVLFPLAFTFMTDVDFALLLTLAAAAGAALLQTGRWRYVALSAALIVAATLSRQVAVVVALPLLALYVLASHEDFALRLVKGCLPLGISATALLSYEHWMRTSGRLPSLYDDRYSQLAASLKSPAHLAVHLARNAAQSGLYLGLFCLPLLLLIPLRRPQGWQKTLMLAPASLWAHGVTILALASLVLQSGLLPTLPDVLWKAGVGPFALRDTFALNLESVPEWPPAFWVAVTALSLLGLWRLSYHAASLTAEAWAGVQAGRLCPALAVRLFGLSAALLYLLPFLPGLLFDRYVAVAAPLVCMSLALGTWQRATHTIVPAAALAVMTGLLAVLGTHDYLGWNRARWAAIRLVETSGEAGPTTLDGGFEYNGDHAYDEHYVARPEKSWWWVADDRITIAFGRLPGTEVLHRLFYATWLPPGERSIVVLRRQKEH